MSGPAKPLPRVDPTNRAHYEGAAAGRLVVQQCDRCKVHRFPPAPWCPSCGHDGHHWAAISGRGVVWSYCVFHRLYFDAFAAELPYAVALVQLDEGPKTYCNLPDVPLDQVRVGMRVKARFVTFADGLALVQFEDASNA